MHYLNLSHEDMFILKCCNANPGWNNNAIIINFLNYNLDWEYILNVSQLHKISSLLYKKIKDNNIESYINGHFFEKLKKEYYKTAYINTLYLQEYNEILYNFNKYSINVIPLKGIALLETIYPDIALRFMHDIDLLIKKKDLEQAGKILKNRGYYVNKTYFQFKKTHFHITFIKKFFQLNMTIELHWDVDFLDSSFQINIDDFWNNSIRQDNDNNSLYNLSLEDTILFFAFHIYRDSIVNHRMCLINFCDIARILNNHQNEINWDLISKRTKAYKIHRPVSVILYLLKELFQLSIPNNFIEEINENQTIKKIIYSLVSEKIFPNKHDSFHLPHAIIDIVIETTCVGKLKKMLNIFLNISIVFRNEYHHHSSILKASCRTVISFYEAILVFFKMLYIIIGKKKKPKKQLYNMEKIEKSRRERDKWISEK